MKSSDILPESESLIERFSPIIRFEHLIDDVLFEKIKIAEDGLFSAYYAPFDHVNANSRVVIVGLTPGRQQAVIALKRFRDCLVDGKDVATSLAAAKLAASFGGPMRSNLVAMLDEIAVNRWLGIQTCGELFLHSQSIAHFTSVLRYPVFLNSENYSGQPSLLRNNFLRHLVKAWFATELRQLSKAIFVPLGATVESVLVWLSDEGLIDRGQILSGLPHPSGANAERISYFLARKSKAALSKQTNADLIDRARETLSAQISRLPPLSPKSFT